MKIYFIIFLTFTLFACKANKNISSISDRVTNASNKIVSIVKSEKTKTPPVCGRPALSENQMEEGDATIKAGRSEIVTAEDAEGRIHHPGAQRDC